MDDLNNITMCEECGKKTKNKLNLNEHMASIHHNTDFKIGVEYDLLIKGWNNTTNERCNLCNRNPPGYMEYAEINGEIICSRCIKRLGEEIEEDRVHKWETEKLVPKNL